MHLYINGGKKQKNKIKEINIRFAKHLNMIAYIPREGKQKNLLVMLKYEEMKTVLRSYFNANITVAQVETLGDEKKI